MCQSKVVLLDGRGAEVIMTDVVLMDVKDDGIELMDILGNKKILKDCRVESVDFISHKIFLRRYN